MRKTIALHSMKATQQNTN